MNRSGRPLHGGHTSTYRPFSVGKRPLTAAIALAVMVFASWGAFAEGSLVVFSPPDWDFGTLVPGKRAFLTLHVANGSDRAITVSVLPTCDCLSTGPSRLTLPAGGGGDFRFSFLAEEGEGGKVQESYLIQTDLKGMEWQFYKVKGVVSAPSTTPK